MKILGLFLTLFLPIYLGGILSAPFHRFRGIPGFLASGTVVGLTLFTTLCFLFSLFLGKIDWYSIFFALLVLGCSSLWIRKKNGFKRENHTFWNQGNLSGFLLRMAVLLFLSLIVIASMREVIHVREEGYFIGFEKNLGDLPYHIHFITSFLYGDNIPPEHPFFSGVPFRYHFLCDFYSAVLWFATGEMTWSLELPGIFLGLSFIVLFYQWTTRLTSSPTAGVLAPLLFLLNGGMGFLVWFKDLSLYKKDWLPHAYSMLPQEGLQWANVIYTLLIPQRPLQFVFPLVVFLLAVTLDAAQNRDREKFIFLAFLAVALPFFHVHAVIVMTIFGSVFFCFYPSKRWFYLILPLVLIWLPQILFLTQIIGQKVPGARSFIRLDLGWEANGMGIPWFWLKNAGPFIPLLLLGFWSLRKRSKDIQILAGASFLIFLLGNCIIFSPWSWDNIKILIFWYLGSLPLVSLLLAKFLEKRKVLFTTAAMIFILMMTLSGSLDIARALREEGENHRLFSKNDIRLSDWVLKNIPKNALFLAQPTFDQPLVLTGRKSVLGYLGHVWSHGLPLDERIKDVEIMSKGLDTAMELMKKYGVTHILYGLRERNAHFNRKFFDQEFEILGEPGDFVIYDVPL